MNGFYFVFESSSAQFTGLDFLYRHNTIEIPFFINVLQNHACFDNIPSLPMYRATGSGRNYLDLGYVRHCKSMLIGNFENSVMIGASVLDTTHHQLCKVNSHSFSSILVSVTDTYFRLHIDPPAPTRLMPSKKDTVETKLFSRGIRTTPSRPSYQN